MATQTGSIDLKSAKKAHDDAEKVATNFVSDFSNGILVHPENDTDNGVKITDKVEIMRGSGGSSVSVAEFGTSVRVGQDESGKTRTEISGSGMRVVRNVSGTDMQIANLGYGEGTDYSTVLGVAPNYSLGMRNPGGHQYDPSATYNIGDICIYDNVRYVCISKIATPEAWNSAHWQLEIGNWSVAEGYRTIASGYGSHAEGRETAALSSFGHAEGRGSKTMEEAAHAEGYWSYAKGECSHAEGQSSVASGFASHSQNFFTIASKEAQTALGTYNVEDTLATSTHNYIDTRYGTYAVIIGNGTEDYERSDALEVSWDGNVYLALDTNAGSGTDHDLYAAITALGWGSDVIV